MKRRPSTALPDDRAKRISEPDAMLADLALQGGGVHGTITWGVLDRLLGLGLLIGLAFRGWSVLLLALAAL